MDLENFEKMVKVVLRDLLTEDEEREPKSDMYGNLYGGRTKELRFIPQMEARVRNLMNVAIKTLPEHQHLFTITCDKINARVSRLEIGDAISVLKHLLEIIGIEKSSEVKIESMRIFESAEEKMKQVNLAFRKEDYNSCFSNLNTTLELILKDKLRIPLTITKVNTSKIVDILVKHKIEPFLFLKEARKHITDIANKIKHQGYSPSKSDCIFAIKAMEELISRLRDMNIELSEEIRNKIHEGL